MANQKNLNEELQRLKARFQAKDSNRNIEEVELSDGTVVQADLREFYDILDMIASNYGLGGCKSLEEFAKHIDDIEQGFLINIIHAIVRRNERMYGKSKPTEDTPSEPHTFDPKRSKLKKHGGGWQTQNKAPMGSIRIGNDKDIHADRIKMAMFLKSFGADYKKVDEAVNKLKSGKINTPSEDFSWITPEVLKHPDFDLKTMLQIMKKSREGSINFNVSMETLEKRKVNG